MATKINFERWSGLLTGRIATIHSNDAARATLEFVKQGEKQTFVMERYDAAGARQRHELDAVGTDETRLDAHWQGFCVKFGAKAEPALQHFALEVFSVGAGKRIYDIQFDSRDATTAVNHAENFMTAMFSNAHNWSACLQRVRPSATGKTADATRMQVKTWNL